MIARLPHHCFLAILALAAPLVHAANPEAMLTRIQRAAQELDYDGFFVYRHADQLESLRILHKSGPDGVRERLVSLNGPPREITRSDREVRCYLPDQNAVTVEYRNANRRNFPSLLPDSLAGLTGYYTIRTAKGGRVAGRRTESVLIKPRDGYRYGYHLWADLDTGLLLKASLLDERGAVIEQYMFTHVTIGKPIPESELQAQNSGKSLVWHRPEQNPSAESDGQWGARVLPAGYVLTARMMRNLPGHKQPVEHLVYSDGFAAVSAFIEPVGKAGSTTLNGLSQVGAVHAFGIVVDGHRVVVVGEVPAAAVSMIGESIGRKH